MYGDCCALQCPLEKPHKSPNKDPHSKANKGTDGRANEPGTHCTAFGNANRGTDYSVAHTSADLEAINCICHEEAF
jgi:hypothetical protein